MSFVLRFLNSLVCMCTSCSSHIVWLPVPEHGPVVDVYRALMDRHPEPDIRSECTRRPCKFYGVVGMHGVSFCTIGLLMRKPVLSARAGQVVTAGRGPGRAEVLSVCAG